MFLTEPIRRLFSSSFHFAKQASSLKAAKEYDKLQNLIWEIVEAKPRFHHKEMGKLLFATSVPKLDVSTLVPVIRNDMIVQLDSVFGLSIQSYFMGIHKLDDPEL